MPDLKLHLFGPPRIVSDLDRIELNLRKALALVSYLAISGQEHSREMLATMLWPESDQSNSRARLRRTVYRLNQACNVEVLVGSQDTIGLNTAINWWIDVLVFRSQIADCLPTNPPADELADSCLTNLANAADLYTDDFMAGFTLSDSTEFDDWQFFQREELRDYLMHVLTQLTYTYQTQANYNNAIHYARRWLALDALHEPAHRMLITLYGQSGQQAAALRQYDECVRLLDKEFGVPPEEETTTLYEAIKAKRLLEPLVRSIERQRTGPPERPASATPATTKPLPENNLPPQPTAFIGRQNALADIRRLLIDETDCQLVSILGHGGMGKTRLALAAAEQVAPEFSDGVYFIDLTTQTDPNFIVPTIAQAMKLNPQTNLDPTAQLLAFLRDKHPLLVLDNLEHLLEGAETLSTIVRHAPHVKLLTTSRERLNLQEEWRYELRGLSFPDSTTELSEAQAQSAALVPSHEALALFLQRAKQADASFSLTKENGRHIAHICQLVGGMPLALELAAAWVHSMTCEEIAQEIMTNLDFLSTSVRNVQARHRSLRAVIDYAWQQLSEAEQKIFIRLSVFKKGFTAQAARTIIQATLPILSVLTDKALLRRSSDGRFSMHELIRQYAWEKLNALPDAQAECQMQHSLYFGEFMQTKENDLKGAAQQTALQNIEADIENVRSGWYFILSNQTQEARSVDLLDPYIEALFLFYDMRSQFRTGDQVFGDGVAWAMAMRHQVPDVESVEPVLGKLLSKQGWFAFHLGRHKQALALLKKGLELLQSHHLEEAIVFATNYLGAMSRHLGDYEAAADYLAQSLEISRAINDSYGLTIALNISGQLAYLQGEYEQARNFLEESIALKRTIGDMRGVTFSLTYLGTLAEAEQAYDEATTLFEESQQISEAVGDSRGVATALNHLGDIAVLQDQPQQAEQIYQQSLAIFSQIHDVLGLVATHTKLGELSDQRGNLNIAWEHYQTALQTAQGLDITPQILDTLVSITLLLHKQNHDQWVSDILKSVMLHPVISQATQDRAKQLHAVLSPGKASAADTISAEDINDIDNIIAKILAFADS